MVPESAIPGADNLFIRQSLEHSRHILGLKKHYRNGRIGISYHLPGLTSLLIVVGTCTMVDRVLPTVDVRITADAVVLVFVIDPEV